MPTVHTVLLQCWYQLLRVSQTTWWYAIKYLLTHSPQTTCSDKLVLTLLCCMCFKIVSFFTVMNLFVTPCSPCGHGGSRKFQWGHKPSADGLGLRKKCPLPGGERSGE